MPHSATPVSTALFGVTRGCISLFILSLNSSEFSIKTYNWRIYQAKVVMEIMCFTAKEMGAQKKSV